MVSPRETRSEIIETVAVATLVPRWMVSYIGAGTGSLIIQVAIAVFAGALVALKIYWRNIVDFFKREKSAGEQGATGELTGEAGAVEEQLLPAAGMDSEEKDAQERMEENLLPRGDESLSNLETDTRP